eukprot:Em0005g844a
MGGTVWAGGSGVYQQQKPGSWTKLCDGVQWGSVITSCNGKVISIGGAKDGHYSNCIKILDEASRKWAAMPSMIVPCHDPCVVYNCGAQSWHREPSLPGACWGASSVVNNGMIYVAGGTGMENSVWCAEIDKLMAVKAYWVDAVVLSNGDIVVVDGCSLAVMKGEAKVLTELRKQVQIT